MATLEAGRNLVLDGRKGLLRHLQRLQGAEAADCSRIELMRVLLSEMVTGNG